MPETKPAPQTLWDFESSQESGIQDIIPPEIKETPAKPEPQGEPIPIKSRSSEKTWPVFLEPDYCPCKAFQTAPENNKTCFHVSQAREKKTRELLESAIRTNEYFLTRWERELKQRFHTYEAYYGYCWNSHGYKGKPEVVYLANMFIALLYCQKTKSGTLDMLHRAVAGQYKADKRINGPVITRLKKAGFITEPKGIVKSDRAVCHHAPKNIYKLTEKGIRTVEAVT